MRSRNIRRCWAGVLAVAALAGMANGAAADDLLFPNSDFEQGDLTNWETEGEAFQYQPTLGDNVRVRRKTKAALLRGRYWAGTYERYQGKPGQKAGSAQMDQVQGGLHSKSFVIRRPYIRFLIGGAWSPDVAVQLIVNGGIVRTATGAHGEVMREVFWDVSEWEGQQGLLYIFDRSAGNWGHINVDDFRFAGEVPDRLLFPNSDFELGDLGNWTAEGEAFSGQPLKNQTPEARGDTIPTGPSGKFWLRSVAAKDGGEAAPEKDTAQGVLRSVPFTVKGKVIACRAAGGKGKGLRVEIHVEGAPVEWIRGINEERMRNIAWDVSAYRGKMAEIVVTDEDPEAGAYLSVDDFHYGRIE